MEDQSNSRTTSKRRTMAIDHALREVMYRHYMFPRKPRRSSPTLDSLDSAVLFQRNRQHTPFSKPPLQSRLQPSDMDDMPQQDVYNSSPPSGPRAMRFKVEKQPEETMPSEKDTFRGDSASNSSFSILDRSLRTTFNKPTSPSPKPLKRKIEDPELPPNTRQRRSETNETNPALERGEEFDNQLKKAKDEAESFETKWKGAQAQIHLSNTVTIQEKSELKAAIEKMEKAAEANCQEMTRLKSTLDSRTKELDVARGTLSLTQLEAEEVREALTKTQHQLETLQKSLEQAMQRSAILETENIHRTETAQRLRKALEEEKKSHWAELDDIKSQMRHRISNLEVELDRARSSSSRWDSSRGSSAQLHETIKNLESELARNVEWRREVQRQLEEEKAAKHEIEVEYKALEAVPSIMELARRIGQITDKVALKSSSAQNKEP